MNLIIAKYIPKCWASRSKMLLKRRKKAIKSRTISQKKLKQESKLFNYAKQYRALQIQKQMDKRKYPSQHINQLMDQIFYPDVSLAREQGIKLHLQLSLLKQYKQQNRQQNRQQISQIMRQIEQKILGTQLIQIYNQNKNRIELNDCIKLFKKLQKYFQRYEKIKQEIQRKWKKMNQNIKKKDKFYQERKCPYIFIDKEDIFHFQPFNSMIDHFVPKMESKIQEQSTIIWNTFGLAQIIESMYRGTGYNPFKIFQIFHTYLSRIPQQQIQKLRLVQLDQILKSINLQSFIRYPTKTIIPTQQQLQKKKKKMGKINKIIQIMIIKVLSDPKIDSYQISTVLNNLKYGIVKINKQIQYKLRTAVLGNLASISFQKVVDLFDIYLKNGSLVDEDTLISLKFDIYRKCPNAESKAHLFQCLEFVDKRYLHFQVQNSIKGQQIVDRKRIYGFDILKQIINIILYKYCGKNELKYNEVDRLIKKSYNNNINDISLLELICSQVVKLKQLYKLNQLSQLIFKIYLMGYRSLIIIQILYEEYKKRYHSTKKNIQDNLVLMIQGNNQEKTMDGHVDETSLSSQQLMLQEDLIISLWLLILSYQNKESNKKLPVLIDELIKIYPLNTASRHPLIYQLIINLNEFCHTNKLLWAIKCIRPTEQNRKQIINNRLNQYYSLQDSDINLKCMKIQAKQSQKFLLNYHLDDKKFIPYPWSRAKVYHVGAYLQWVIDNPNSNKNYFNQQNIISEQIKQSRNEMRKQYKITLEKVKDKEKSSSIVGGNVKFYEMD